jgi:hypothetical protein
VLARKNRDGASRIFLTSLRLGTDYGEHWIPWAQETFSLFACEHTSLPALRTRSSRSVHETNRKKLTKICPAQMQPRQPCKPVTSFQLYSFSICSSPYPESNPPPRTPQRETRVRRSIPKPCLLKRKSQPIRPCGAFHRRQSGRGQSRLVPQSLQPRPKLRQRHFLHPRVRKRRSL